MVGMVLSGPRITTNLDSISNRGCFTGGSCGGNKKPGTVSFGPSWPNPTISLKRAPQRPITRASLFAFTNRNPVQYNRNGYAVMHSGMLG